MAVHGRSHSDCSQLLGAACALLKSSGLCSLQDHRFTACFSNSSEFEGALRVDAAGRYARYRSWLLFAVAGENLIKAWAHCTRRVPHLSGPQNTLPFPPDSEVEANDWIARVGRQSRNTFAVAKPARAGRSITPSSCRCALSSRVPKSGGSSVSRRHPSVAI